MICLFAAGALALAGCHRPPGPSARPGAGPTAPVPLGAVSPGIIVISLDTLRADQLGCYGNPRPTSPFLDALAARSVRYARCSSQAPRTAPSHMTLFTGLYPTEHRVRFGYNQNGETEIFRLDPNAVTLAQALQRQGYRTAAFTGGGELAAEAGFNRGFDVYHEGGRQLTAEGFKPVKEWLTAAGGDKFFLFLHTYQIHDPYLPPPPYNTRFDPGYQGWIQDSPKYLARKGGADYQKVSAAFWRKGPNNMILPELFSAADLAHLLALYDGNIAFVDDFLKDFFHWMEQQPWWGKTTVIILSDHGEEFMEHGYFLHRKLYTETLHVPLIVHYPGDAHAGTVVPDQVGLIDVHKLILGGRLDASGAGDALRQLNTRLAVGVREAAPGVILSQEPWLHPQSHWSVRDGKFTLYVQGGGEKELELFDAVADPGERKNVAIEHMEDVARLMGIRQKIFAPPRPLESHQLSGAEQPGLRADGDEPRPALGQPVPGLPPFPRPSLEHGLTPGVRPGVKPGGKPGARPGAKPGARPGVGPGQPGAAPPKPPPRPNDAGTAPVPASEDRKKKLRALGYIQ